MYQKSKERICRFHYFSLPSQHENNENSHFTNYLYVYGKVAYLCAGNNNGCARNGTETAAGGS